MLSEVVTVLYYYHDCAEGKAKGRGAPEAGRRAGPGVGPGGGIGIARHHYYDYDYDYD